MQRKRTLDQLVSQQVQLNNNHQQQQQQQQLQVQNNVSSIYLYNQITTSIIRDGAVVVAQLEAGSLPIP